MAHYAVIAPPLPGHFNPLRALGSELVRRGHRITFVHLPDAAGMARGEGIGFEAIGSSTHPPGWLDGWTARMARLNGPLGLRRMIADVAGLTDLVCREGSQALRRLRVDAVIADQMEPGAGLVSEHLGLPFVTTATGLPINREGGVPPPYVGWRYDPTQSGRKWNEGGYRISDLLMGKVGDVLEHHSVRLGLPSRRRADQFFSPQAQLAQAVAGIDFPRSELPSSFHYLGPFRAPEDGEFLVPNSDERPLVFCSLGTLQGSRSGIFQHVAKVCAKLGLRLLIAHGGRLPTRESARLAGDPLVFDFVPQRAVLAKANLAITHAGFNTVLDALSFGVPLVAIPLAFEQPATAARLDHRGVAKIVPRWRLGSRLQAAVEEVLGRPSCRANAAKVKAEIASAGGVSRAADLAEAALRQAGPGARREASTRAGAAPGDARDDSRSGSR
jgi:MGT family glycosyltransferase